MKGIGRLDILLLSLTDKDEYAVMNILQSLDNAKVFCSYLDNNDLRNELEDIIERFIIRTKGKLMKIFDYGTTDIEKQTFRQIG